MIVSKLMRSFLVSVVARFESPDFACQTGPAAWNVRTGLRLTQPMRNTAFDERITVAMNLVHPISHLKAPP